MTKLPIETYDATEDVMCWRPAGLAAAAAVVALLMVACSDAKTVTYYKDHQPERAEKVSECLGQASSSQDCVNARQAEFEAQGIPAVNGKAVQP